MSADRPLSSRFSPRSLVGIMTQAASNPDDIARPPAVPQQMLTTGIMLTKGEGVGIMVDVNGIPHSGSLLTDEPLFEGQTVWVSPTGNGRVGIHGAVR